MKTIRHPSPDINLAAPNQKARGFILRPSKDQFTGKFSDTESVFEVAAFTRDGQLASPIQKVKGEEQATRLCYARNRYEVTNSPITGGLHWSFVNASTGATFANNPTL